ncbi:MAG: selenide, water dikinase SelD [Gammaproteobacteria bacterium]|nr:selenide, water dikinase SelD [Gammaproteobacteria bacterium]
MQTPVVKDLVLIGGGHTHLAVLRAFGMRPLPGVRLTLISRNSDTPYSGMLPGLIAGHYHHAEMRFDLRRLADFAGGRFMRDEVIGLDLATQHVHCRNRPPVGFDLLSINTGSTPSLADLREIAPQLVPVKPIDEFNLRWLGMAERILAATESRKIGVVGAGAGGVELVLSIKYRLSTQLAAHGRDPSRLEFHLFTDSEDVLSSHNRRTRSRFQQILAREQIQVHFGQRIVSSDQHAVYTASGQPFPLDEVLWVTSAAPASWFATTGLALTANGDVRINPDLRSASHPTVFAVGDCAAIENHPRPKSGVYAVRQGPPLAANLRRACLDQPLRSYRPQRDALSLISTGDKRAVASRGTWCVEGAWVWRWKDYIDRRFMRKYQELPLATMQPLPIAPAQQREIDFLGTSDMRCGGCGSKVGADIIAGALQDLGANPRSDVLIGLDAPDDAAITELPANHLAVHTIDGFRAFLSDPYVFGQVTAAHSLSDVFAMGGQPQSALAYVTLPLAASRISRNDLKLLLAGARTVLESEDTALVGGHTAEGPELSFALAINGYVARDRIRRKHTVQAGDHLILTKPLGTGVLFAGAMRGRASGADLDEALGQMVQTNGAAARCLAEFSVHAMTDITGFGLLGHLVEMLRPSGLRARIELEAVPALRGACQLAEEGIQSSLHPQNALLDLSLVEIPSAAVSSAAYSLLFDPQTSGGLLLAIQPTQVDACLLALRRAGYAQVQRIGAILEAVGG